MQTRDDPVRAWLAARGCRDDVVDGGLEGLVDTWERVVQEIERGYDLTLDDYLNDLDARDLLDRALALASDAQRSALHGRVAVVDTRFRQASVPCPCVWGEEVAQEEGWLREREWWYFVRPRRAGSHLAHDLVRAGL